MATLLSFVGRVALCAIFLLAAVGHHIPHFREDAIMMGRAGMPYPEIMLGGAIVLMIVGSVSVILGVKARLGAFLLLVFLCLAAYQYHAFWKEEPNSVAFQTQMSQFMKNMAMAGAMLFIVANGSGRGSLDNRPPLL